ncbi:mas-related G-protein coupled receptor member D [Lagenorhynchus albirostris]|uniref:mas-related G-protein coupled receptor member D n=1 Tax=Lagenorhynchus albirostris TaxID=27610 RepID=UPI0028ED62A4|nr:mas-related G-protein coupled receptor member D [Lagenorhynchus albirostris]
MVVSELKIEKSDFGEIEVAGICEMEMNKTLNSGQTPAANWNRPGVHVLGTAHWVLGALVMFTCVGSIMGNGLVVWLLGFHGQRGPYKVCILHLAVADLLVLQVAGLSLLTAISTQRCLSVLLPVWYKCHRPRHLPGTVCVPLWAPSLPLSTLASLCGSFWHRDKWQCFTVDLIVSILITGTFTPAMATASLTLCTQVQRSSQRRRPTRLYVAILASVLVFVCVLPLGVSGFLLYWLDLPQRMKTLFGRFARLSLSSGRPSLREPLGAVLRRALWKEPELEEGQTLSTGTNDEAGV